MPSTQEPSERQIIDPPRQFDPLKSVGEPAISQKRPPCFGRAGTDEWDLQIICEEANDIEKYALLSVAGQLRGGAPGFGAQQRSFVATS